MKNPRTMLLLSVIVAVLLMGVAYAAIQNINLTVSADVVATADQGNFKVVMENFSESTGCKNYNYENNIFVTSSRGDLSVNYDISGMKKVSDYVEIQFEVHNESEDLNAFLKQPKVTCTNTEYFDFFAMYNDNPVTWGDNMVLLTPGSSIEVYAKVELSKLPISGDVSCSFGLEIVAEPDNESRS